MTQSGIPLINAEQTAIILQQIDVIGAMRRIFSTLAAGQAVQPSQKMALLPDNKGDVINYFGVDMTRSLLGVKVSPYLVHKPKPVITAWTLLMSAVDGMPLMLCDASLLTIERTAATTALAVDLLARDEANTLSVIGTGAVGRAHIRQALAVRPWKEIRVWSRTGGQTAQKLSSELGICPGLITICATAEEAVKNTDVLMLCTSSATPVVDLKQLTRSCLITSISTNAPGAHEIAPGALAEMDVYCDYRKTTPSHAGEMVIATREHGWTADRLRGDLPELVTHTCVKPDYRRHVFFRSLGLGLEDIAVADCVLTHLKEQESKK